MFSSLGKATEAETERFERMMQLGCCACAFIELWCPAHEAHHLLLGGRKISHTHTIPLCEGHHRKVWRPEQYEAIPTIYLVSIADGRHAWNRVYPTERALWETVQKRLRLPTSWPTSKILPRNLMEPV